MISSLKGSVAACAAGALLAACGSPPAAAEAGQRILVKLKRPSVDGDAIAAEASRQAGLPIRYAAAVSPAWHALWMQCPAPEACEAASARLRRAGDVYESVQADGRARIAASAATN